MNTLPPFEQQYPTFGPALLAIAAWYRQWRAATKTSDLVHCTASDVARMANDIGLTVNELRALERTDGPLLLPRMLTALKIDAADLARTQPAALRDLQRVCSLCDSKRRCGTELAEGDAAATFESFCPNAVTLKALT